MALTLSNSSTKLGLAAPEQPLLTAGCPSSRGQLQASEMLATLSTWSTQCGAPLPWEIGLSIVQLWLHRHRLNPSRATLQPGPQRPLPGYAAAVGSAAAEFGTVTVTCACDDPSGGGRGPVAIVVVRTLAESRCPGEEIGVRSRVDTSRVGGRSWRSTTAPGSETAGPSCDHHTNGAAAAISVGARAVAVGPKDRLPSLSRRSRALESIAVCSECGRCTHVSCRPEVLYRGVFIKLCMTDLVHAPTRFRPSEHFEADPIHPSFVTRRRKGRGGHCGIGPPVEMDNFRTAVAREWVVAGRARYAVTAPRQRGAIAIGCVTPRAAVNAHDGWAPGVSGWIGRVMRAAGSSSAPTHAAGFILPPRESSLPAILAERPLGDTWEGETGCTAPRRVVIPSHRVAAFPVPTIVTVDADRGTLTVAIGNKEWTQHLDAADTGAPLAPCIAVELSGDVVAMHRFV
mmetsp:Transcript_32756/g.98943  ORF Transcript_32756/g.98943 Transcript_32756/m.98943 type:complete len:457 (+) Transcript_32756:73-1443(+)